MWSSHPLQMGGSQSPFARRSALRQELTSLAPICGGRALYRRQPEDSGYLAVELATDEELQLADGRPMLIL
jgi:hypothetical protein